MSEKDAIHCYVDSCFRKWKDQKDSQTYVIPHYYSYKWPHVLEIEVKLRPDVPNELKGIFGNMRGKFTEHEVLNAFVYYCQKTAQPAFIFHNFKWLTKRNITEQETDIIIVHREVGIILVEIKSSDNKQSKKQLDKSEKLLKKLHNEASKDYPEAKITQTELEKVIRKVTALPHKHMKSYSSDPASRYYELGKNNLESFDCFNTWWDAMIGTMSKADINTCRKIYYRLIPVLFANFSAKENPKSSYNNIVIAETVIQLKKQSFLQDRFKDQQIHMMPARNEIKFSEVVEVCNFNDGKILQKVWDYITLEQWEVWKKNKQVICGPFGSGKTVLIQCKAATLACSQEKVLVIVPHHLVANYKEYFKEVKLDDWKFITLISITDFYRSFLEYEKLTKSRHVFIDELLYPTTGDLFGKYDKLFIHMLSQLLKENGYCVWIASHAYSITKDLLFDKNFESVHNLRFQFRQKFKEYFVYLHTTMRTTKEIHNYKNQLEFKDFCDHKFKIEDLDKIANDEFFQLLYMENFLGHSISGSRVETIEYSKHCHNRRIIKIKAKDNHYWYNKHKKYRKIKIKKISLLYFSAKVIIKRIKYLMKHTKSSKDYQDIAIIIDYFEKQRAFQKSNNTLQRKKHCLLKKIEATTKKLTIKHEEQKMNCYMSKFIKLYNIKIRGPLETVKAHLRKLKFGYIDGKHAITMCYSNKIASLQWPVVFHIQCTNLQNTKGKRSRKRISFLQSDHSLIISRCMGHYVHICHSDMDRFTNKSFGEKFFEWRQKQQNNRKSRVEALKEYSTTEEYNTTEEFITIEEEEIISDKEEEIIGYEEEIIDEEVGNVTGILQDASIVEQ